MRKFEKISFEQFKKDIKDDINLYESYNIPVRKTKYSAGYDFESLYDFTLKSGEVRKFPLGIKVCMNEDEALFIMDRSSAGFKYNVRLTNQIGVIDYDYYNNESNEGHMYVSLQNHGDKDWVVRKGDSICQGIFVKYLKVDDEKEVTTKRTNGFGSTNKGGDNNE